MLYVWGQPSNLPTRKGSGLNPIKVLQYQDNNHYISNTVLCCFSCIIAMLPWYDRSKFRTLNYPKKLVIRKNMVFNS